jgi:TIR domain
LYEKRDFKELLTLKLDQFLNHPDTNIISYKSGKNSHNVTNLLEVLAREYTYGHASIYNTSLKEFVADEIYKTSASFLSVTSPTDSENLHNQEQITTTLDKERRLAGYLSYSPKGSNLKQELEQQLLGTQFEGVKIDWQDGQVTAGEEWEVEITNRLENAHVILLLINAEYLVSFISSRIEMTTALKRHNDKKARVIPIILGSCSWSDHAFIKKLQHLPRDGKAVNLLSVPRREEAFQKIILEIKKSIKELKI